MTYIADILMRIEVTERASAEPLIKYLREGKPLTDAMRDWLIGLLEHKKKIPVGLKLIRAPGRRRTDDKLFGAYYRVKELSNAKITGTLFRDIVKQLPGRKPRIERQYTAHRFGENVRYKPALYHVAKNDRNEFTLIERRRLSHETACRIAALQFDLSPSYVKRAFREIEAASR